MRAGQCVTYDKDLGQGWNHLAAVRKGSELRLYVNGNMISKSSPFNPQDYDLTVKKPLKIGFGEYDYFSGRIREVRFYNRAISEQEIATLQRINRP
jgi:hypothetical protein